MLVLGGVAASYMATGEAETEMDPVVTDPEAVFATRSARFHVFFDCFHVGALMHGSLPWSPELFGN
jgi:hypothetical protein